MILLTDFHTMNYPTVVNGIHEKFCKCQLIDYCNLVLLNLSKDETLASIWHQLLLSMLTSTSNDYFFPWSHAFTLFLHLVCIDVFISFLEPNCSVSICQCKQYL